MFWLLYATDLSSIAEFKTYYAQFDDSYLELLCSGRSPPILKMDQYNRASSCCFRWCRHEADYKTAYIDRQC
jgi:hypothetical protein